MYNELKYYSFENVFNMDRGMLDGWIRIAVFSTTYATCTTWQGIFSVNSCPNVNEIYHSGALNSFWSNIVSEKNTHSASCFFIYYIMLYFYYILFICHVHGNLGTTSTDKMRTLSMPNCLILSVELVTKFPWTWQLNKR
jgi:hypothetical protein